MESSDKSRLLDRALSLGFSRARLLCPLPDIAPGERGNRDSSPDARSALLVFLPYDLSGGEGTLAPFARSNYYREAVTRLKKIVSALARERGLSRGDLPIFCNSPYPEKRMAWLCGLGSLGRNSLIITPEYGSLGIIAGIFLPLDLPGDAPLESTPFDMCGACRLCREACPGGAVRGEGGIERSLCYQNLSTRGGVLPREVMAKWRLLYGCQICQEVCPRNGKAPSVPSLERGYLGAAPDLDFIVNASEGELGAFLKGTVLGQSWIEPALLRRNALICLWNEGGEGKRRLLRERFLNHPDPLMAGTMEILSGPG